MLRFLIIFLAVLGGLFMLDVTHVTYMNIVLPWTHDVAVISAATMQFFDPRVIAHGETILNKTNGFGVLIMPGCNGVEAVIVLAAAVIAFPASIKQRLLGLLIGSVAIELLNVIRIICLFYLGQWNYNWFEFAHMYLWPGLIMLDVLAIWITWVRWVSKDHLPAAADAGAV